jgi:sodium-dependent dicarboxylate transporter 2/3/5
MNSTEFLLIGGFILALTMEKWNLHRRIALRMILLFGIQPYRLMLGMMIATFLSSTMVSNVAAVMMVSSIANIYPLDCIGDAMTDGRLLQGCHCISNTILF